MQRLRQTLLKRLMKPPDEPVPVNPENRALPLLLIAVSAALAWILLPFYGTILWGAIIALVFAPLHRRFGVAASARASASVYTTVDEIEAFREALAGVRPFFGLNQGGPTA